jgi:hypothetical protein
MLHIRDGEVTRFVVYFDRERAVADLSLASESYSPGSSLLPRSWPKSGRAAGVRRR